MSSNSFQKHLSENDQVLLNFSVSKKDWDVLSTYFQECNVHKCDEDAFPFFWYLIDCALGRNGSDESRLIGELMSRYCRSSFPD